MRIDFAHIRARATNGRDVNIAVFDAKPLNNTDTARRQLLNQLTFAARGNNLRVEASGLVYEEYGQLKAWGDHFVVDFLDKNGIPQMTHYLDM